MGQFASGVLWIQNASDDRRNESGDRCATEFRLHEKPHLPLLEAGWWRFGKPPSTFICKPLNLDSDDRRPETLENLSVEDVTEDIMGVEQPQRSKRFHDMLAAAEKYYAALEDTSAVEDQETIRSLRQKLDELEEPFADNPAYVAFLRLQRSGKA